MSYADIQRLQSRESVGKSQSWETSAFILRNDLQAAWKRVSSLKDARIDLVLDNGVLLALFPASPHLKVNRVEWDLRIRRFKLALR
jgi:hypothetical protein